MAQKTKVAFTLDHATDFIFPVMDTDNVKTIEAWLQELPEPYRSQALTNMWWEDKNNMYLHLHQALFAAFNWSRSPEKYIFWHDVYVLCRDYPENLFSP